MKNRSIIIPFVILTINHASSQDILNFYRDWEGTDVVSDFRDPNGLHQFANVSSMPHNYNGEYVINANDLPWLQDKLQPANFADLSLFRFTHKIEIVSFPFSMDCSFLGTCADGSIFRELNVPADNLYDPGTDSWDYNDPSIPPTNSHNLYNISPKATFTQYGIDYLSNQITPYAIVSAAFKGTGGFSIDRFVMPHTILKHIISLDCGLTPSSLPLTSFLFYTDLTRGSMRQYPFTSSNSATAGSQFHDLTIRPGIITVNADYSSEPFCSYGISHAGSVCDNDPNWKGDVLDYTPFNLNDDNFCNLVDPLYQVSSPLENFFDGTHTWHLPIGGKSLIVSTGIRNVTGQFPAGYSCTDPTNGIGTLHRLAASPIVQQYNIDKNINLERINYSERVIYNPSEVNITADDLHFPPNYTFKTIRATYPFLEDVIAQNIPENGGVYNTTDPFDPNYISKLAVETDLTKDFNIVYPYPDTDPKYSAIYHLINGSKLTIEPCVRIFDATFEVQPGSEMVFENWPTNQINVNRYQLLFNGGIVTKRANSFLFQNYTELKRILRFTAGDYIFAGYDVNLNEPQGNYIVDVDADVSFIAENEIDLLPGFEAKLGSNFLAAIDIVNISPCPPMRLRRPFSNNSRNQFSVESGIEAFSYFQSTPNPAPEEAYLMFELNVSSAVSLKIYNSIGELLSTIAKNMQLKKGKYVYKFQTEALSAGMYFARLESESSVLSLKILKL